MFFNDLLFSTINSIKKAAYGFDEFGLKFSPKHLDLMFPKILSLPLEEQAEYADYICVSNINEDWLIQQTKDTKLNEHDLRSVNVTTIGNLAYIALNCKDIDAKTKSLEVLGKINEFYKNK